MRRSSQHVLMVVSAIIDLGGISLSTASADTLISWANPSSSGNWSNAVQWTPATSPNGAYSVTLPSGSETVTLDISPTIDALTLAGGTTLQTNSGTSLTTGSLSNSGQINFASGGSLIVSGAAENSNTINIGNGTTMSIAGAVTNSGNFTIGYYGSGTVSDSGTFNNTGNLSVTNAGGIVNVNALNNQAYVSVESGTSLNITGGGSGVTDVIAGSTYNISGNFNVINGGVTTSALANLASVEGILDLASGQTYNWDSLTNSNSISVGAGTTTSVAGNITNSGNFTVGYYGSGTVNVSGTFNNSSTGILSITSAGGIVNVNALNNQGYIDVESGTSLNITGGSLGVTDVVASSTYRIAGNFNIINSSVTTSALANLASVEGTLDLASGQTYNWGSLTNSNSISIGAGTTASVAGNVTNNGNFTVGYYGSGTVNVSGTFKNAGSLNLGVSGDSVTLNALANQGTLSVASGALLDVGSGTFSASSGYQQLANGAFDEVIGGASIFGAADIVGPMSLSGTLDVTLANGFTPSLGESFAFLDGSAGELSGAYASIIGQPFSGGQWQATYNNTAGTVTLTAIAAVPEPATISLLGIASSTVLMRRHRRRSRRA